MIQKLKAPGGGPGAAGRMRRGAVALPIRLYYTRERAKPQEAVFDKALSHRLDCVLALDNLEISPLWGLILRVYRRRLERGIPAR